MFVKSLTVNTSEEPVVVKKFPTLGLTRDILKKILSVEVTGRVSDVRDPSYAGTPNTSRLGPRTRWVEFNHSETGILTRASVNGWYFVLLLWTSSGRHSYLGCKVGTCVSLVTCFQLQERKDRSESSNLLNQQDRFSVFGTLHKSPLCSSSNGNQDRG